MLRHHFSFIWFNQNRLRERNGTPLSPGTVWTWYSFIVGILDTLIAIVGLENFDSFLYQIDPENKGNTLVWWLDRQTTEIGARIGCSQQLLQEALKNVLREGS